MATKGTYYGSELKKLEISQIVDGVNFIELRDNNNNIVGSKQIAVFNFNSGSMKLELDEVVEILVPANAKIRSARLIGKSGLIDEDTSLYDDIGAVDTIYIISNLEVEF